MDAAIAPSNVLPNGPGEKLGSLSPGGSIVRRSCHPFSDDLAFEGFLLLEGRWVVEFATLEHLVEATGGPEIELDPPVIVSLAKIEGVAIDGTPPLLRSPSTELGDDDSTVIDEPLA